MHLMDFCGRVATSQALEDPTSREQVVSSERSILDWADVT